MNGINRGLLFAFVLVAAGCQKAPPPQPRLFAPAVARLDRPGVVRASLDGHLLIVKAEAHGLPVNLAIDTGASTVVLKPEAATRVGLAGKKEMKAHGFGGQGVVSMGELEQLEVGPAVGQKVPAAVYDLPHIFEMDGFVGLSFLNGFLVRINYEYNEIEFLGSTNRLKTEGLPLQIASGVLAVEAKVDGVPGLFMVDTGAGGSLILNNWFVEEKGFRGKYPRRIKAFSGIGFFGETIGEMTKVNRLTIGTNLLTNVVTEFASALPGGSKRLAGVIGAEVLNKFNLTLDVKGLLAWLEPNRAARVKPSALFQSGLAIGPTSTDWIIKTVVPNSPAEAAGVEAGDIVRKVNGRDTVELKFAEIRETFRQASGTRVELVLERQNGQMKKAEIVLRDFYEDFS